MLDAIIMFLKRSDFSTELKDLPADEAAAEMSN